MKRPSNDFLLTVTTILALILFYQFGRPIWQPVKYKLMGQQTIPEVITALGPRMKATFSEIESMTSGQPLCLLIFKEERRLELWKRTDSYGVHIKDYPMAGFSGHLGPKLREGDDQIPEGIYRIASLNPNSAFHLSMLIDYPNAFDRAKASIEDRGNLGGEIFIHGGSATIGCIPVGDQGIEELFYLVASNGPKNTEVIIAPYDMRKGPRDLQIAAVGWENELYTQIAEGLKPFPLHQTVERGLN